MRPPTPQILASWSGRSPWRLAIRGVVAGLVLGLAQPGWGWPWLGLGCVVPFWLVLWGLPWRARMLIGWIAGSVSAAIAAGDAAAIGLRSYFELSGPAWSLAWLLADQVLGGGPLAVAALLVGNVRDASLPRGAARAGSAWVLGECVRDLLFPGAWLPLAASLTPIPIALGAVAVVGSLGLGGLLASGALLCARAIGDANGRAGLWGVGLLACVVVLPMAIGRPMDTLRIRPRGEIDPLGVSMAAEGTASRFRILLVQSGVDARAEQTARLGDVARLDHLLELTRAAEPVDLAIWPEGAVRSSWPQNAETLGDRLGGVRDPSALIVGAPWIEPGSQPPIQSVAAVLLDEQGAISARHLKTRLVPLAEGPGPAQWGVAGQAKRAFLPAQRFVPLDFRGLRIGASICYEILFSALAREQVAQGARILVNLSNESWLGSRTRGPQQMLAAAVLRAIETGRPVLRATTTGVTAAIDGRGRVQGQLPLGKPGVLRVEVIVHEEPPRTLHVLTGDGPVMVLACLGLLWGGNWWRRLRSG